MSRPLIPGNSLMLAAGVAIILLFPAGPLLAQGNASGAASGPSFLPFRPVVAGHHVQPRRQDICRLLHRSLDCQRANTDALDDDLLSEILRRSAR
jgi:hypothetical protein